MQNPPHSRMMTLTARILLIREVYSHAMCYSALIEQDIKVFQDRYGAIIVNKDWEAYPKVTEDTNELRPPLEPRIYPGYYAPVLYKEQGELKARLMKYSVEPPEFIHDPRRYTSYNARRDNLNSPFWSECFRVNHGFILLKGFFEWVAVKDLLKAGRVSMAEINAEFEQQKSIRKQRLKAAGKPYKPTKAELTAAQFRKIALSFTPDSGSELFVPVIFSKQSSPSAPDRLGFAIVTDNPPAEVAAAGHDRCPIFLTYEGIQAWIENPRERSTEALDQILSLRPSTLFTHEIAKAS